MKTRTTILTTILVILSQACTVFSIHPLYTDEDRLSIDEIIGTWESGSERVIFNKLPDNRYKMTLISEDTILFSASLLSLNNQVFIDLFPFGDCDFPDMNDCLVYDNLSKNFLPVHSFLKADLMDNQIILTPFNQKRLLTLFEQNRIRLAHEMVYYESDDEEPIVVLTASTPDLQKFISRYANDEEAFDEPTVYQRSE